MKPTSLLEISDEIIAFDPQSLARKPVHKQTVIDKFLRQKNFQAVKILSSMPEDNGFFEKNYVDQLFIRIHCELQRVSEEFQHGQRVAELLVPLIQTLMEKTKKAPVCIVDIGCGTGYVLRWLAAHIDLTNVKLIGADYNSVLIKEAQRLADLENLTVHFVVANAFEMSEPAAVYISTGVIHHFQGNDFKLFLQNHNRPQTMAFCHFDFQPSIFSIPGAWVVHVARMREPVCFHDGLVSARRAHTADAFMSTGKDLPFDKTVYSSKFGFLPIPRAMHTFLGIRPHLKETLIDKLKGRCKRLGRWQ